MRTIAYRGALALLGVLGLLVAVPLGQSTVTTFQRVIATQIGVGTTSPAYPVDVSGNAIGVGTKAPSAGAGGQVQLRDDAGVPRWAMGLPGTAGATRWFLFHLPDSQERLTVTAAGDVGIGQSAPAYKLDVSGTLRATGAAALPGGISTPVLAPDGTVTAPAFAFSSSTGTGIYRGGAGQLAFAHNGLLGATLSKDSFGGFEFSPRDGSFGTGSITGSYVSIGRNLSGSGAAGFLELTDRTGSARSIWVDGGNLRIGTGRPTENDSTSHSGGTVVGTQTSSAASKTLLGEPSTTEMLETVLRTRVHRFTYRDGRFNGEQFVGIVTDESPWFGMDRNRVLNPINGLGYTVGAIQALEARVRALEARGRKE